MLHTEVYEKFKFYFPRQSSEVFEWFPNGLNSIRVRRAASELVFTYNNGYDWCLETVDSFINKMKGDKKMNVGLHDHINKNE